MFQEEFVMTQNVDAQKIRGVRADQRSIVFFQDDAFVGASENHAKGVLPGGKGTIEAQGVTDVGGLQRGGQHQLVTRKNGESFVGDRGMNVNMQQTLGGGSGRRAARRSGEASML